MAFGVRSKLDAHQQLATPHHFTRVPRRERLAPWYHAGMHCLCMQVSCYGYTSLLGLELAPRYRLAYELGAWWWQEITSHLMASSTPNKQGIQTYEKGTK